MWLGDLRQRHDIGAAAHDGGKVVDAVLLQRIDPHRDDSARAVAQGVETRADFLAAHDMGFDLVQGYLFGKPVAVRKFARARPQLAAGSDKMP